MSDEQPWQTKSQIMVTLGKSSRTIDLYVRAGKVERMQDGSRAFFRLATSGNAVTPRNDAPAPAWAVELQEEIRALREEIVALRSPERDREPTQVVTPPQLAPGNEALPRNAKQRAPWWRRFLFIDEM